MKRIKFSIAKSVATAAITFVGAIIIIIACDNMNSLHEKYLDRGEGLYIGVADSITMYPGYEKIKFRWKINADPRIDHTTIYWDRRAGNKTIPVNRTSDGEMWLETVLEDLSEAEYLFEFVMGDKEGNVSRPVEVAGVVYGDLFIENLRNRGIKQISRLETGETQIEWELPASTTLLYSIVEFTTGGSTEILEVPNDEVITRLTGLNTGDNIEIYAVHLPENGLEPINSLKRKFIIPRFERLIDKSKFTDAFKPGDNTTPQPGNTPDSWKNTWPIGDNRDIRQIWDNNTRGDALNGFRGIYHSVDMSNDWENAVFKYPHCYTFSIGVLAELTRLKFHARTEVGAFTGHSPRYFEVWATDEPKTVEDFEDEAAFELYYRTTYVEHKAIDNQIQTNPNGNAAYAGRGNLYIQTAPPPGIYNWQKDWIKLGDFENVKPSGSNYNTSNDADRAVWGAANAVGQLDGGFDFELKSDGKRVKYIRLVVKYPNWQHTNCINIGEVTFWGDDL
ncbi:MAG: hypothetical protein LBE91_07330 [Tannerella sp.]|jgi:hypothetical protein|nr:hypothetical protein [Tannerella sp.]